MIPFSFLDIVALTWYLVIWIGFTYLVDYSPLKKHNISVSMAVHRRRWMRSLSKREFRMIDTGILNGLQNGTAFFASHFATGHRRWLCHVECHRHCNEDHQ